MHRVQAGPGIDAEIFPEQAAGFAEGVECLGLPSGAVEREHLQFA